MEPSRYGREAGAPVRLPGLGSAAARRGERGPEIGKVVWTSQRRACFVPDPKVNCLNAIYFEQGSVTRGSSDCWKLEFLSDETSCLKWTPKRGPELRF